MDVPSVNDVTQGLLGTLRRAAAATGAGFDYLLSTAMRESSLNPVAKASSSSASGMFQFVEQTWLQMVKEAGPSYGLGAEARQITRNGSGRYDVDDSAVRARILALRNDPAAASVMAGAFTARNRETLAAAFGRAPTDGELYIAHFLGAQGAIELTRLAATRPDAAAAASFREAARANRSIFYASGKPRGAAEVYAELVSRHGGAATSRHGTGLPVRLVADASEPPAAPGTEARPVFHAMFATGRRSPVSSYVQAAWSAIAGGPAVTPGSAPATGVPVPSAAAFAALGTSPAAHQIESALASAKQSAAGAPAMPSKRPRHLASPPASGLSAPLDLTRFIRTAPGGRAARGAGRA